MTRENRVRPTGEIAAIPLRGGLMGNRGILHDAEGRLGPARWRHHAWVCCVLAYKGNRRTLMAPGRYTELFFLDEAVALAAGHRPCAQCRHEDHQRFAAAWARATGARTSAAAMDAALHAARVHPRTRAQVRHQTPLDGLPDGAFVLHDGAPALVRPDRLVPFTDAGYGAPLPRPAGGTALALTPAPTLAAMRGGYAPALHPAAA